MDIVTHRIALAGILCIVTGCYGGHAPSPLAPHVTIDHASICRLDDSVRAQVLNDGPATTAGLSLGHAPAKEVEVPHGARELDTPWPPECPKALLQLVSNGEVADEALVDQHTPLCD